MCLRIYNVQFRLAGSAAGTGHSSAFAHTYLTTLMRQALHSGAANVIQHLVINAGVFYECSGGVVLYVSPYVWSKQVASRIPPGCEPDDYGKENKGTCK